MSLFDKGFNVSKFAEISREEYPNATAVCKLRMQDAGVSQSGETYEAFMSYNVTITQPNGESRTFGANKALRDALADRKSGETVALKNPYLAEYQRVGEDESTVLAGGEIA